MARKRKLDETDRRIVEAIQAFNTDNGTGPRYQDIADATGVPRSTVDYRINAKLVPAGLVKHDPWGRGTIEATETDAQQ